MRGNYQTLLHNLYLQLWINTIEMFFKVKAVSDDTIFACDCSRLHQTRFQSCRVRGTIASCETNLRQSGGIGANRVKNRVV